MTAAAPPPQDQFLSMIVVELPAEDWHVVDVRVQHQTPSGILVMPQVARFHDPSVDEVLRMFVTACDHPDWRYEIGIPHPDPAHKGKMLRGWVPLGAGSPLAIRAVPRPPAAPAAAKRPHLIVEP